MARYDLIGRYDAIVGELAGRRFSGDLIGARIHADDVLAATAMEMLGQGFARPEPDSALKRAIAGALCNVDDIPGAVNRIFDVSCARVREMPARDTGAVFTPEPVARYMCRRAIESYLVTKLASRGNGRPASIEGLVNSCDSAELVKIRDSLESMRLVDTSCGTGIFLGSALKEVCRLKEAVSQRLGAGQGQTCDLLRETVANNIYGLDIEAYSVKAAKTRLLLLLAASGEGLVDVTGLQINIFRGNALIPSDEGMLSGRFDVIVGNPPYMRVKSMFGGDADISDRKRKKRDFAGLIRSSGLYEHQEGNLNLYKLFIERNLELLRENGSMCLIFPSSFLNEASSTRLRKWLFSRYEVEEIVEIPERSRLFDGINQATCILACNKRGPGKTITIRTGADNSRLDGEGAICVDLGELAALTGGRMEVPLLRSPDMEWAMLASLQRIPPFRGNEAFPPVGEISVGSVDETIDKEYISHPVTGDLFVKGIHLKEYSVDLRPDGPGPRWVRKEEFLRKRPAAARAIASPRIIGRNTRNKASGRRLKFAPLPAGYLCGNSIKQIVVTDKDIDPLYLMALLNSSVLNWRFEVFCSQNNIRNYSIEALPIPRATSRVQEAFAFVAGLIMESHGEEREFLDKKIMDAMAYELYFMEMRMLSSAMLSSMDDSPTAGTLERQEDIAAIISNITSREGFKVVQSATYRS